MTNETAMLKALLNGLKINPKFQPQNNKQAYLAYLCGLDIALPEPRTVEEILLCKLCADGGKYLHTMTIRTYLGKITMTLINNSAESLTRVYRENTDIFNGAILMIPAADIGQDEDFYATVIGYEYSGDVGILMIDKDFPFPVISSMPNVIDVISGEVIDNVSTKDGGKLEQEKKIEITKNGVTEIFPDEGYTLSRVVANVNVGGGENKLAQAADNTITELAAEDLQGATFIKDYLFYDCLQLSKISIPEGITKIGNSVFGVKNDLSINREFYIPKSLKETLGLSFARAPQATVYYAGNLVEWCSITFSNSQGSPLISDNSHLYVNNNELIQGDITIPDEVSTIPANAFYALADIKNVNTNNVQTIRRGAFSHSFVENIVFGSSLTTFSDVFQFSDCLNLKTVRFNSQPTGLENRTFIRSTNITDIYVPWSEGAVSGAPWGATNATIHYDTPIS